MNNITIGYREWVVRPAFYELCKPTDIIREAYRVMYGKEMEISQSILCFKTDLYLHKYKSNTEAIHIHS